MNWYVIELGPLNDEWAYELYDFRWERQIRLPAIAGRGGKYRQVPLAMPREFRKHWKKPVFSDEEFHRAVQELCQLFPQYAELFKSLPPSSEVGQLFLQRVGPACPELTKSGPWYVAREALKESLTRIPELSFLPTHLEKIVSIEWELGGGKPKGYRRCYVSKGVHSPKLAAGMGSFYEVILPTRPWFDIRRATSQGLRVAFEGTVPSNKVTVEDGLVELSYDAMDSPPWVRLQPADPAILIGCYDFVREDVYEILAEPARWCFQFKKVETF